MCSTLCGLLMLMVVWSDFPKTVRSTNPNRYKDKIYKVFNTGTDFKKAQAYCEDDGGMLAQISQRTVTGNFYAPLSQFLRPQIGRNCAWIGAKDVLGFGRWVWTDGTPVLSVPWTIPPDHIFYYERYFRNCGRLCQGDRNWIWEPVRCGISLKFVCEYVDPDAEHCVTECTTLASPISAKGVSSADGNRHVENGKIYKIPDIETDFANAVAFCEGNGGRLAKVKPEPGTMRLSAPMSRYLSSRVGESCVFIGAADQETEGAWLWLDGTRVYSVFWSKPRHFYVLLRYQLDCGRLCHAFDRWYWKEDYCDISSKIICEYDAPELETTLKPSLELEVKPLLKPKPKKPKANFAVASLLPDSNLIIGDPVLFYSVVMRTSCCRRCVHDDTCILFNFNKDTRECRGFSRSSSVTHKKNPNWEVWVLDRL